PLTGEELRKFFVTFERPFQRLRRTQERLSILARAGLLKRFRYVTDTGGAAPHYYKLSRKGFATLFGPDAEVPRKRFFDPVTVSLQRHTQALASFLVHLHVSAKREGIRITDVIPENCLKLNTGIGTFLPDATFDICLPDGRTFRFYVEVDHSTESLHTKNFDGWERRVARYETLREESEIPFRVLVLTIIDGDRLGNIFDCIAKKLRRPERSLFYGVTLSDFLTTSNAAISHVFKDHGGTPRSLVLPPATDKRAVQMALQTLVSS
ncbi:MAG: replication-relaxation family protein, partial [Planctomycetaceae bacterium]|nr:replication-relaxation family protein [Planctomycetaceae bacterium]